MTSTQITNWLIRELKVEFDVTEEDLVSDEVTLEGLLLSKEDIEQLVFAVEAKIDSTISEVDCANVFRETARVRDIIEYIEKRESF